MEKLILKETFQQIISTTEVKEHNSKSFDLIIEDAFIGELNSSKNIIKVIVSSSFNKIIIEGQFYSQLNDSINKILQGQYKLIIIDIEEWSSKEKGETTIEDDIANKVFSSDTLNPKYTFNNFVVSEGNKGIFSAAMAISLKPGVEYNPFFIYGGSGLGKTHTLHSIGNKMVENDPNKRVKYISSQEFGTIIYEVLSNKGTNMTEKFEKMKIDYQSYDVLLLDDIQMIQTWSKAKEILFGIFDWFLSRNKQVVITSDQYPSELKSFEDRYKTRFLGGLTMGMLPPDIDAAREIVKMKVESLYDQNIDFFEDEALEYIAVNFSSSVRELEGAIKRVIFWTINEDVEKIGMSEVLNIFKGMTTKKKGVTIKLIINEVAKYYQIPAEEIRGKSRKANIAIARHIVCYLSKELADVSLLEIAKELTKNHSTIISSISKIKKEKDLNENLNKALFDLRNNII